MEIYLCLLDSKSRSLLRDDYTWEVLLRNMSLRERQGVLNIKNEDGRFIKALNTLLFNYVMNVVHPTVKTNVSRGIHGKPMDLTKTCGFNLSDEDGMVALALNLDGSEIGIDLATSKDISRFRIKPEDFVNDDFKDIFTEDERSHILMLFGNCNTDDEKNTILSQYWALKESYCKYEGIGITFGLDQFQFIQNIKKQEIGKLDIDNDNGEEFKLISEINLDVICGYEPMNVLFDIGDTGIICSIFGHCQEAKIFKVDTFKMVRYLTQ